MPLPARTAPPDAPYFNTDFPPNWDLSTLLVDESGFLPRGVWVIRTRTVLIIHLLTFAPHPVNRRVVF
jgi:hypothetical protein